MIKRAMTPRVGHGRRFDALLFAARLNRKILPSGTRHHRLTRSHRRRRVGVQPTSSNVAGQQCLFRPEYHETIGDTGLLVAYVTEMVATRKRSG